jgi:hypothetical protein
VLVFWSPVMSIAFLCCFISLVWSEFQGISVHSLEVSERPRAWHYMEFMISKVVM